MAEDFASFVIRHRFLLSDIVNYRQLTRQDVDLAQLFPGLEWLWLSQKGEELKRLNFAMAMAGYMADCETDQPDLFSKVASDLSDDEWNYVLRFCPYHAVDTALRNLDLIVSAMEEACLGLNAAKAGMETAIDHSHSDLVTYSREQSKATVQLLNFAALYASYIDVCRRIREQCQLKGKKTYDRAIGKLLARNIAAHSFVKDLRNFTFHYLVPEPSVTIQTSEYREVSLLLSRSELLYSGFEWKADTRIYLQAATELDVMKIALTVTKDVRRIVRLHRKIVDARLGDMKFAYETYLNERARYRQLSKAVNDIGAAFKRPSSLALRLLKADLVDDVLRSALTDEDAERLLVDYANRHRNLPKDMVEGLRGEIKGALRRRPRYPIGGPYLSQRKFE